MVSDSPSEGYIPNMSNPLLDHNCGNVILHQGATFSTDFLHRKHADLLQVHYYKVDVL